MTEADINKHTDSLHSDTMNFETFRNAHVPGIEGELSSYLSEFSDRFQNFPRLDSLISSFVRANEGGKRIRGLLVLLGAELSGRQITTETTQLAALYEVFQTGLLIHDDVIDRSDTRRGRKSVFAEFGGDHYAISQGISLGDLGYFFAERKISQLHLPFETKAAVLGEFNEVLSQTAIGQMLDISLSKPPPPTKEEIISMIYHKTAIYTFIGPLRLGMIASGEMPPDVVEQYGRNLGIAFQLQDDILGIFGEEETTGKSTVSDIQEGKYTLLYYYALEHTDEESRKWLEKTYGSESLTDDDIIRIRQIFDKSGARAFVEQLAQEHFALARESIPDDIPNPGLLHSLIDYITVRQK